MARQRAFLFVVCFLISSPLFAVTRSWTGATSGNWSDATNWSPAAVPVTADTLIFPVGASHTSMTNDIAGLSVGPLTFNGPYVLSGNELTLTGDINQTQQNGSTFTCNAALKLANSIQIGIALMNTYGAIDVNGHTLTIGSYNTTVASLNGSGTVNVTGFGMTITGSGSFNGTISGGVEVLGSMPNANLTLTGPADGTIAGTGSVGTVTVMNAVLKPGAHSPCCPGPEAGVLHTKSLAIGVNSSYEVELAPGSISDAVQVTGTVTLQGALHASIISGSPSIGQTFTIIDNDGSDAVAGTFAGLPEGSPLTIGTSHMSISYMGGDGNDVVLTTVSALKTWTGSVSGNWSDVHNWSPQAIPVAGEPLVFPFGPSNTSMTNDIAGLSVGPLTFNGPYVLSGNELTLTGDINQTQQNGSTFTCNAPLKLANSIRIGIALTNAYGAIDVNGQTLTIGSYNTTVASLNGSGTVNVTGFGMTITGSGSFNGTINGGVEVLGSMPNANLTLTGPGDGTIAGTGTVGTVTVTSAVLKPGAHLPCCVGPAAGVLHTKSLALGLNSSYNVELAPGSLSDAVQVTGTVTLNGRLNASIISGSPSIGQTFTIIDNDGADAVNGTFTGLPERATLTLGGQTMRISYQGGDGNDVVLSVLQDTSTILTQSSTETKAGEPWTLTATVNSAAGLPAGVVSFSADGASLGTAAVVNGVASLTITGASAGTRHVTATFLGTGIFADSVSALLSHVAAPGLTSIQLAVDQQNTVYGQLVHFTATVGVLPPAAGQPAGTVTILADGNAVGTAPLVNGIAVFETSSLHAGSRSMTATYSGDTNFEASTATASQLSIAKAQTRVDASAHSVLIGSSPTIAVTVTAPARSDLIPSGNVTVSDAGGVIASLPLARGTVSFALAPLPGGDHLLSVSFSGDADFEASSATVTQTVTLPAVSCLGTHIAEGNQGITTATIVVTLSEPVLATVRISFTTVAGDAREGEDYEKASGVVEFGPGQITRSIELHIFGDTIPEATEAFSLLLFDPVNATIDTPSASIVIVNDDQVPPRRRPSRP